MRYFQGNHKIKIISGDIFVVVLISAGMEMFSSEFLLRCYAIGEEQY